MQQGTHHSTRFGGSCFLKPRRRGSSQTRFRLQHLPLPTPLPTPTPRILSKFHPLRWRCRESEGPSAWHPRSALKQPPSDAQASSAPVRSRLQAAAVVGVKATVVSGRCPGKGRLEEGVFVSRRIFPAPPRSGCRASGGRTLRAEKRERTSPSRPFTSSLLP